MRAPYTMPVLASYYYGGDSHQDRKRGLERRYRPEQPVNPMGWQETCPGRSQQQMVERRKHQQQAYSGAAETHHTEGPTGRMQCCDDKPGSKSRQRNCGHRIHRDDIDVHELTSALVPTGPLHRACRVFTCAYRPMHGLNAGQYVGLSGIR